MREAVVSHIANERADLLAYLQSVNGPDWDRITVCAPWTVKDVLAHIVEGELNVGKIYRGEHVGGGFVDAEEGIARWAALPGEAVRAALWQHGTATQRVLEAMTDEVYSSEIDAFGCRRIAQLTRLHLFDLAVHAHDITDALGAPPLWGPRLEFLCEFVVRAAPAALARHGLAPFGQVISVRSGESSWCLAPQSDGWAVGAHGYTSSALEIEPGDLVLVATGRSEVSEVLERAKIEGDATAIERVLRAWRVV